MKKRRLFSIMAASVLAVSLLAGCGGKSATADGQTDKAEAQAQSGQSSEKKVLRVWLEKVFSDDANTFLQKRVEQYAQEKGVEVQFEFDNETTGEYACGLYGLSGDTLIAPGTYRSMAADYDGWSVRSLPAPRPKLPSR